MLNEYIDVMIDIETTGTKVGAGVYQIGAIYRREDGGVNQFICTINPLDIPILPEQETIAWHYSKNYDNWKSALDIVVGETSLKDMLEQLSEFIVCARDYATNRDRKIRVWCKGVSFDFPLLQYWYNFYGIKQPWHYREICDLRTLLTVTEEEVDKMDHAHNALVDATGQLYTLERCLYKIN